MPGSEARIYVGWELRGEYVAENRGSDVKASDRMRLQTTCDDSVASFRTFALVVIITTRKEGSCQSSRASVETI